MGDKEYPPGCEAFLRYLTAQPLGPYRVERVGDARSSVLVHFRLTVGTCVVPIAVIFDMTRYLTIRVNLADWLGGDARTMIVRPHCCQSSRAGRMRAAWCVII